MQGRRRFDERLEARLLPLVELCTADLDRSSVENCTQSHMLKGTVTQKARREDAGVEHNMLKNQPSALTSALFAEFMKKYKQLYAKDSAAL